MLVSVIIVNYRVRFFLELCLYSVQKALAGIDSEIIVVDNHSEDGSIDYLRPLFPGILFLENRENTGFARANNQALEQTSGEYVLFLNPDTVLPEDFASKSLAFFRDTPGIGGLGVRMIDGSGRFLRESKRGFPTPWVSFCKLSGLTAMFPRSSLFGTYYLGHLPEAENGKAPVLSGACLWVARSVLRETGGFDERFFMYAEDIDLSYRLEKAGYVNYYLADTTIIHFKGESTRKDIRYVRQFYKAMSQFRQKHFADRGSALFNWFIEAGIKLRSALSALGRREGSAPTVLNPPRTFVTGDPAEADRVSRLLSESSTADSRRVIVSSAEEATEIVFCEGREFSFKEGIGKLEKGGFDRNGQRVKFHASGSFSMAGSADRNEQGEAIIISGAPLP